LWSRMRVNGESLDRPLAVQIVLQLARALDFAHRAEDPDGRPRSIVNRDGTPHNLLISYPADVTLTDSGIAKSTRLLRQIRSSGVRGKLGYMAPEQLSGDAVDVRADIFSLGVILWELTLGQRMSEVIDSDAFENGHFPLVRPRELDASYPARLEELVMAALE